jgi:hypothetical protein
LPGLLVEVTGPLTDKKQKSVKEVARITKGTKDVSKHSTEPIEKKAVKK